MPQKRSTCGGGAEKTLEKALFRHVEEILDCTTMTFGMMLDCLLCEKRQNCIITPCPGFNFLCLLHNVTLINSETDKKYFDLNC